MSILINTPTGNIGRALATTLLDAGETLVLVARDPKKVADLAARGARVVVGSIDDPQVLNRAFEGVHAAFWLTPPTYGPDYETWAIATATAAAHAAQANGTARLVLLSSVGAHQPGNGPISIVGKVEDTFRALHGSVLALRAAYFFENFLRELGSIGAQGLWYGPTRADRAVPMVATKDIARVAAEELRGTWSGHRVRGVHGPVDLTMNQAATIIAEALGRDVKYVEIPVSAAMEGMKTSGMPDFLVTLYGAMLDGFATGRTDPAEPRTPETTTPTGLDAFAREVLRPALSA